MLLNEDLQQEYREILVAGMLDHGRSKQWAVGPSGVGTPCDRQLLLQLAWEDWAEETGAEVDMGDPATANPGVQSWTGTQLHAGREEILRKYNAKLAAEGKPPRFLLEQRVTVGEYGGPSEQRPVPKALAGSSDVFDLLEGYVIDWKFPGHKKMTKLYDQASAAERADIEDELEPQYFIQAQCYGRGMELAGQEVTHVAICYSPASSNTIDDWIWKVFPYDRSVSERALGRLDRLQRLLDTEGPEKALARTAPTDNFCPWCPFYIESQEDFEAGYTCWGYNRETKLAAEQAKGSIKLNGLGVTRRRILV